MLRNSEKIMTCSTNQWPQNQLQLDDQKSFMASSSSVNKAMEKPNQDPQQLPLKCPRCDSSNTKFCYYNNYSLSQPRHFCKACKRYWTRGGTLRNVPVGGGCRKNKRVKRQIVSSGGDGVSSSAAAAASANPSVQSRIDLSPASNHINNPLFYPLGANPIELNFPFSTLGSARVSSDHTTAFDLHHQMSGLGVGFSPGVVDGDRRSGFAQIQDVVANGSSNPPFYSSAGNNPIFGSSNIAASTSTMASLLSSGFQQQKYVASELKEIHTAGNGDHLISYNGDVHMPGGNGEIGKEVKMGGGDHNRFPSWINNPNPTAQISASDPAAMVWSTANVGAWFDPSNIGSSVPSLI